MKRFMAAAISFLMLAGLAGCQSEAPANVAGANPGQNAQAEAGEPEGEMPPESSERLQSASEAGDAISVILNGYSARTFAAREVSQEDIDLILQSGAKAPSARNTQPWRFTVVTNAEMTARLTREPVEGPVFIVISGLSEAPEGVDPVFDCALATQNMYIAAQALGLGAHIYAAPIANINANERENLRIPDGYDAIALLCVGYIENEADAISSATPRNPLSDMVNVVDDTMAVTPAESSVVEERPAESPAVEEQPAEAAAAEEQTPPPEGEMTAPDGDRTPPEGGRIPPDGERTPPDGDRTPPDGERMPPGESAPAPPDIEAQ